jgi:hypothetical protein
MHRLSPLSVLGALTVAAAIAACASDNKPANSPEVPTVAAEADPPPDKPESTAEPTTTAMPGSVVKVEGADKNQMLDTYEMTPSDCDALGKKYGELARAEMMATLSPKLSEKQKAATAASVEKAVAPREEGWIKGCMSSLVNKAVDHGSIKCALAAKSVKDFDTCINGDNKGTPQPAPATKPKKK